MKRRKKKKKRERKDSLQYHHTYCPPKPRETNKEPFKITIIIRRHFTKLTCILYPRQNKSSLKNGSLFRVSPPGGNQRKETQKVKGNIHERCQGICIPV